MSRSAIVIAIALAFAVMLSAASAQAQRVFVSATGSDGNLCTFASPCRSFQHAHDVSPANGEIDVLDPAGYGALTITKAISIQGHGWASMPAPSVVGGATLIVTAGATDKINIRGVILDGGGVADTYGIEFASGGSLNIQDSIIRNFGSSGIVFEPSASSKLGVLNVLVSDNGADGMKAI